MNKTITKILSVSSNRNKDNDFWIVEGTPEHRLSVLRQTKQALHAFSQGKLDFDKPMQRDVVKKFYRNAQKKLVEIVKTNNGK